MSDGSRLSRAHHSRWFDSTATGSSPLAVFVVSALLALLISPAPIFAGSLSERFPSTDNYPEGTMVAIQDSTPVSVSLADINNTDFLVGVVEPENGSLIAISREVGDLTVALSGEVKVFVSDINGEIEQGDFIGSSWIRGVGMKAIDNSDQKIIGVALENFADVEDMAEVEGLDTPQGNVSAKIGKITIRIFDKQVGQDFTAENANFLEQFAARIAGKEVVFARIIAASVLFIVSAVISGVFLANAIKGSFISLGRNPLASSSIYSQLIQVSGVSIGVILIGTVLAYIVLIL